MFYKIVFFIALNMPVFMYAAQSSSDDFAAILAQMQAQAGPELPVRIEKPAAPAAPVMPIAPAEPSEFEDFNLVRSKEDVQAQAQDIFEQLHKTFEHMYEAFQTTMPESLKEIQKQIMIARLKYPVLSDLLAEYGFFLFLRTDRQSKIFQADFFQKAVNALEQRNIDPRLADEVRAIINHFYPDLLPKPVASTYIHPKTGAAYQASHTIQEQNIGYSNLGKWLRESKEYLVSEQNVLEKMERAAPKNNIDFDQIDLPWTTQDKPGHIFVRTYPAGQLFDHIIGTLNALETKNPEPPRNLNR